MNQKYILTSALIKTVSDVLTDALWDYQSNTDFIDCEIQLHKVWPYEGRYDCGKAVYFPFYRDGATVSLRS